MINQSISPKNKQELISAIQKVNVGSVAVIEPVTKTNLAAIKKELDSFIGNGSKRISVIFLKAR
jgi:hypothetical protein